MRVRKILTRVRKILFLDFRRVYTKWTTEVDSSIYSTPVIFDVASDGVKDIVVVVSRSKLGNIVNIVQVER